MVATQRQVHFQSRAVPSRNTILKWECNFRNKASALKVKPRPRTVRTPDNIEMRNFDNFTKGDCNYAETGGSLFECGRSKLR